MHQCYRSMVTLRKYPPTRKAGKQSLANVSSGNSFYKAVKKWSACAYIYLFTPEALKWNEVTPEGHIALQSFEAIQHAAQPRM